MSGTRTERGRDVRGRQERSCDERGSGTVLALAGLLVMTVVVAFAVAVGTLLLAQHRVRGIADAVALSAARTYQAGGDACAAARRLARAESARVVTCKAVGTPDEFAVHVTVSRRWARSHSVLPAELRAEAFSGPVGGGG